MLSNSPVVSYPYLEVTRACNEACVYCYNDSGSALPGELSTEQWLPTIDNFVAQGGRSVMFTGGECLWRNDIATLVAGAHEVAVTLIGMNTNGLLFLSERAKACTPLLDEVDISLDGFRDNHDRMRGVTCWESTVDTIKAAKERGIPRIHVNGCLTSSWFDQLEEYLDLLVTLGVTSVKLATIGAIGRASGELELAGQSSDPMHVINYLDVLAWKYRGKIDASTSFSKIAQPITLERFGAVPGRNLGDRNTPLDNQAVFPGQCCVSTGHKKAFLARSGCCRKSHSTSKALPCTHPRSQPLNQPVRSVQSQSSVRSSACAARRNRSSDAPVASFMVYEGNRKFSAIMAKQFCSVPNRSVWPKKAATPSIF